MDPDEVLVQEFCRDLIPYLAECCRTGVIWNQHDMQIHALHLARIRLGSERFIAIGEKRGHFHEPGYNPGIDFAVVHLSGKVMLLAEFDFRDRVAAGTLEEYQRKLDHLINHDLLMSAAAIRLCLVWDGGNDRLLGGGEAARRRNPVPVPLAADPGVGGRELVATVMDAFREARRVSLARHPVFWHSENGYDCWRLESVEKQDVLNTILNLPERFLACAHREVDLPKEKGKRGRPETIDLLIGSRTAPRLVLEAKNTGIKLDRTLPDEFITEPGMGAAAVGERLRDCLDNHQFDLHEPRDYPPCLRNAQGRHLITGKQLQMVLVTRDQAKRLRRQFPTAECVIAIAMNSSIPAGETLADVGSWPRFARHDPAERGGAVEQVVRERMETYADIIHATLADLIAQGLHLVIVGGLPRASLRLRDDGETGYTRADHGELQGMPKTIRELLHLRYLGGAVPR